MDNIEVETWVKKWTETVNDKAKLLPRGYLDALLRQYLGPTLNYLVSLGLVAEESLTQLASKGPQLLEFVGSPEGQVLLRQAFTDDPELSALSKFIRYLVRKREGSIEPSLEWEVKSLPDNGGIYRVLLQGIKEEEK
jgi:hypothetical protein